MYLPRMIVAGTASGVGKTTVTLGLMGALKKKGYRVQGFKVGPDYIDPSHHTLVTGRPSRNLDTWMSSENSVLELFERSGSRSDLSIIEGVMGLFDGYGPTDERGSTAHLAKLLRAPVLLVIDAGAMARSAGALVLGYRSFDRDLSLSGVIANNVAGLGHFEYIRPAIEERAGLPLLGYLPRDSGIAITERHLGLVPEQEKRVTRDLYEKLADLVLKHIDLDRLVKLAQAAGPLPAFERTIFTQEGLNAAGPKQPVIGIAWDDAFHFYYRDNLDLLEHLGAKLVFFSPVRDTHLPEDLSLIYFGGGFPEVFAAPLSENRSMQNQIRAFVAANRPIYAECGGLMYLGQSMITFEGECYPMVGILPITTSMQKKRMVLGYAEVLAQRDTILCRRGDTFRGHEFHWSVMTEVGPLEYAFLSSHRSGASKKPDGIVVRNVLASYTHAYFPSHRGLASSLISVAKAG